MWLGSAIAAYDHVQWLHMSFKSSSNLVKDRKHVRIDGWQTYQHVNCPISTKPSTQSIAE